MDDLNTMTAQALSNLNIKGIRIADPYGRLIGEPEMNTVYFIWGEKGAGKSTFSLGLADALAEHGRVEYIPAEEHFGKTLVDKVKRLDARHNNLNFTKWKSIDSLKEALQANQSSFCVLDSISVIDANDKATVEFAQWCREAGIGFVMVAHANKDGRYKGNTSIAHECDVEIKVTAEGRAETEKNRYKVLTEIEVPFTSKDRQVVRGNSIVKALTKKQHEWVEDQLSNNESSSDEEMVEFFRKEIGLTAGQAKHWVAKRDAYLTDPSHSEGRENPVDVPFRLKLAEIDKIHKFRSWRRINSLMGSKMPCYAKKHSGESETPHFSIRYTPDYNKKKYVVDLLLDGRLEAQICTEGAKGGFKTSWKKLVAGYGDIEIMIFSQDHAKKVLGAREYNKQERRFKKKQKKSPKRATEKPKKQAGKGKRFSLPESHKEYFKMPAGAEIVPLNRVVLGRKPKEAACDRALGHMKKASDDAIQKRDPVTVYKEGSKYIVVGGNCTTTVARRSGWKKLPVTIVSKKAGQSELEKKRKPVGKAQATQSQRNERVFNGIATAIKGLKKIRDSIDTGSAYASDEFIDRSVAEHFIRELENAQMYDTQMRAAAGEAIDSFYDNFQSDITDADVRKQTTSVIEALDEVLKKDAAGQIEEFARDRDKTGPAKKKKKSKKLATKSKKKKPRTKKKPGKADSIDIAAAKKSQSKLDAFLEKVLS